MKIRFNVEETIQKVYELDSADSERVIRRAQEIKAEDNDSAWNYPINYYYECAIQEFLYEGEICATPISEDSEDMITSAWEEDS